MPVLDVVHAVAGHGGTPPMQAGRLWRRPTACGRPLRTRRRRFAVHGTPRNHRTRHDTRKPRRSQPGPSQPPTGSSYGATPYATRASCWAMLGLERAGLALSGGLAQFPLRVPRGFVARMRHGDPPTRCCARCCRWTRRSPVPGFDLDAVGDLAGRGAPACCTSTDGARAAGRDGQLRRALPLLLPPPFPLCRGNRGGRRLARRDRPIAGDPGVDEVILSGGDPLSLAPPSWRELTDALAGVTHLKRLRIHTRLPVVLPERVRCACCDWIAACLGRSHRAAREPRQRIRRRALTPRSRACARPARRCSISPCCCAGSTTTRTRWPTLSERSFAAGVLPYYLHQLDRVPDAAHFEVPDEPALALHRTLAAPPVGLPGAAAGARDRRRYRQGAALTVDAIPSRPFSRRRWGAHLS